jgi:hypothetical protein
MTDNRSQGSFEGEPPIEVKPGIPAAMQPAPMRFQHSATLGVLAGALAKAQGGFKPITKTHTAKVKSERTSTTYTYTYADLADVIDGVREALSANDIAFVQIPTIGHKSGMVLVTRIMHKSGEWIEGEYPMNWMQKPQEQGALLTYARRYSLSAMLGVASEEDSDGGATVDEPEQQAPRTAEPNVDKPKNFPPKGNTGPARGADRKPVTPATTPPPSPPSPLEEPPPPEAPPPADDAGRFEEPQFDQPVQTDDGPTDSTVTDQASARRAAQTLSNRIDEQKSRADLRALRLASQPTLRSVKTFSETAYGALALKFNRAMERLPDDGQGQAGGTSAGVGNGPVSHP